MEIGHTVLKSLRKDYGSVFDYFDVIRDNDQSITGLRKS